MRDETRERLNELMARPMDPDTIRELDAFFDSLPAQERIEAANYGVSKAGANVQSIFHGWTK
jgi:hypothetical protein